MLHIRKEIKLGVCVCVYIYIYIERERERERERDKVGGVGNGAISFLYFLKKFF